MTVEVKLNSQGCQDPLLSYHDDLMISVRFGLSQSLEEVLLDGFCGEYHRGYIKVDFKIAVDVTGIATRGYAGLGLQSYLLVYSEDGKGQIMYRDPADVNGNGRIPANRDTESYSVYWLYKKLRVHFISIYPSHDGGSDRFCMRLEILGCDGGRRDAVGLNQGRIGASFLQSDKATQNQNLWNVTYLYKDIDRDVGWCPLKNAGVPYSKLYVFLEGIHSLAGFAVLNCPAHQCLPVRVTVTVYTKRGGTTSRGVMVPTDSFLNMFVLVIGKKNVHQFEPLSGNWFIFDFMSGSCDNVQCTYCMQMELYGKELECRTPLGVESSYLHPHGTVKNEQMTASSAHADHPAHHGRRQHFSAWCADPVMLKDPVSAKSQYLQIEFLMVKNITAIATEGFSSSFVKDFYVYYATDEGAFHSLREREGNEKVLFSGYTGHLKEPHYNWFYETPFLARYVRINPQHWNNSMCLRVEFLGCDAVTFPLGLEFGILSNNQITASSEEATNRKNWGRLNNAGWCASSEVLSSNPVWKELYHYLQIDLLQPHLICSVATQGKETKNPEERSEAVTSFYLKYSFKGDEWSRYHRLLVGEYYGNSVMRYWLDPSVAAKFIQFNPQSSWSPMHICMRVEIYSCVLQGDLSNYLPLGMESFRISDAQLSASSEADASHSAVCSRLNHHIQGGAWIPAKSDRSEYLQIDLGWIIILTGIATQGHPEKTYRTLAFKIRYGISLYEGTVKDYPKTTVLIGLE